MSDVLTPITTAIAITKELLKAFDATKNAEAKLLVADLQLQLAETRSQLAELIEENTQLKTSKSKRDDPPELVVRGDLYYSPDGDGPFCAACFDSNQQLVRVSPMAAAFHVIAKFRCNVCHGHYQGE